MVSAPLPAHKFARRHAGGSGARCRARARARPGTAWPCTLDLPRALALPQAAGAAPESPGPKPLSPGAAAPGAAAPGSGEKPSPTPAFCAEAERCSLRAAQPGRRQPRLQRSQGSVPRPSHAALGPPRPATLPTLLSAPEDYSRRSSQLPREVLARFPRDALLNPKGTGPWKTPFSSLSEPGSFRLGLYLVPLAGHQVLGLALVEASFRVLFLAIWGAP